VRLLDRQERGLVEVGLDAERAGEVERGQGRIDAAGAAQLVGPGPTTSSGRPVAAASSRRSSIRSLRRAGSP